MTKVNRKEGNISIGRSHPEIDESDKTHLSTVLGYRQKNISSICYTTSTSGDRFTLLIKFTEPSRTIALE